MKTRQTLSSQAAGSAKFDLLRARIEVEIGRPAVLAVTSSTAGDGKEITARSLAYSLSYTGYSTLFIDTSLASRSLSKPAEGLALDEIGRQQPTPDAGSGNLAVLTLSAPTLQRTTSQRGMQSALEILRSKFDYVIVSTEYATSTSFAASIIAAADGVLVSVKTGRRQTPEDGRLAAELGRMGPRFLGIVAIDPSVIKEDPTITPVTDVIPDGRRRQTAGV